MLAFALAIGLAIDRLVGLPGWSGDVVLHGFAGAAAAAVMTIALQTFTAFFAGVGRGYLPGLAWAVVAIFLAQVTELGGKVIFGTLIIVVGVFLARILANLVGSGTGEGSYAQTIVRYAIIALFTAIGLTFMGLADQIVMMAFGLILGAAAVATALSFGLGGREAAGRIADHWADQLTGPRARPPAARSKPAATAKPENDQPPLV